MIVRLQQKFKAPRPELKSTSPAYHAFLKGRLMFRRSCSWRRSAQHLISHSEEQGQLTLREVGM